MKSVFIITLIFCLYAGISAQNNSPEVTNVTFVQRTDGTHIVDIYYDVNDSDGDELTILAQASDDNGSSWNFSCENVTGDVGEGITSGNGKHIIWDFASEHPNVFGDQFRIKIIADDGANPNSGGIPCPGFEKVYYEGGPNSDGGGTYYTTVLIGEQCWIKENLNVGIIIEIHDEGHLQTDNSVIEKYCYTNDPINCEVYGGLYEWNEAMQYIRTAGSQGICPNGWHIPTLEEFETLEDYVNDEAAKLVDVGQSTYGYTPTNETGFSALFAGFHRSSNSNFDDFGENSFFQSSTESSTYYASTMILKHNSNQVIFINNSKTYGFSVRCVQD